MDIIKLRAIRAFGKHGANPGERENEQPFDVNVRLEIDLRAAAHSDDLADTLDYAELHAQLVAVVESTSFALLERLAEELLHVIFRDARVARAEVHVAKPELLRGATPGITLCRENPRYRSTFP